MHYKLLNIDVSASATNCIYRKGLRVQVNEFQYAKCSWTMHRGYIVDRAGEKLGHNKFILTK